MIEVQKLRLDPTKRIIITSDIHGNLPLLKNLLDKVNYTEDDYLFINGDLCEKGEDSLEVVNYVQKLVQENEHVFVTKGNCDVLHRYVFQGNEGIIPYIKQRKQSILNEMLNKYGKGIDDFSNLKELGDFYTANFFNELHWLESLAVAYETQDFIIVHAGIEHRKDWYQTDETTALYAKAFHEQGHLAGKTVIVGHWPVVNYRSNQISSNNPFIDWEKNIISIDGGNRIKRAGQLNALIVENGQISFEYVDELEKESLIKKEHKDNTNRVGTVTYPNYELKIFKRDSYFTQCENVNLGIVQWVKNEYLLEKDGRFFCKSDVSVTILTVKKGEIVKIVDDECEGYVLVKKQNGEVGWIPQNCIQK